jgi:hypothetical protein
VIPVLAHHLEGGVAAAFALPPLILVIAAVIWLRRREPDADQEFDWTDDEDPRN